LPSLPKDIPAKIPYDTGLLLDDGLVLGNGCQMTDFSIHYQVTLLMKVSLFGALASPINHCLQGLNIRQSYKKCVGPSFWVFRNLATLSLEGDSFKFLSLPASDLASFSALGPPNLHT
jgi:hypothetical protein